VNDGDFDWPNVAAEIGTVGRSERAAVRSRILDVLERLIKLQASPAVESGTFVTSRTAFQGALRASVQSAAGRRCRGTRSPYAHLHYSRS
jgi:hypothetical protein